MDEFSFISLFLYIYNIACIYISVLTPHREKKERSIQFIVIFIADISFGDSIFVWNTLFITLKNFLFAQQSSLLYNCHYVFYHTSTL